MPRSKQPSGVHPGEMTSRLDSRLHVMSPSELRDKFKKEGKCHKCGMIKTHEKRWGVRWKPLTNQDVYKGICLRCHSITEAKTSLNEQVDLNDMMNATTGRVLESAANHNLVSNSSRSGSDGNSLSRSMPPQTSTSRSGVSSLNSFQHRSANWAEALEEYGEPSPGQQQQQQEKQQQQQQLPVIPDVPKINRVHSTEEEDEVSPLPVPSLVGPRMGGLQRDVSELTLDSTVLNAARSHDVDENLERISEENESPSNICGASHNGSRNGSVLVGNASGSNKSTTTDGRNLTGMERMEERIRAKIAEENQRKVKSTNGHSRSKSHADPGSLQITGNGHVRSHTGGEFLATSAVVSNAPLSPGSGGSAGGAQMSFEEMLRTNAEKTMPTCEERLRVKTEGCGVTQSSSSGGSSGGASSTFEERLRSKTQGGGITQSSSSGDSNSGALAAFEQRLRSKTHGSGTTQSSSSGGTASGASTAFEARSRLKKRQESDATNSSSSGDTPTVLEDRFRLKSQGSWDESSSAKRPAIARVQYVSMDANDPTNSKYRTLMERKMAGETNTYTADKAATSAQATESPLPSRGVQRSMQESKMRSIITESTQNGNISEILDILKSSPPFQAIVILALGSLRECLARGGGTQQRRVSHSSESMNSRLASSLTRGWLKVISMTMSSHSSNQMVQLEGLGTIWAAVSLSPTLISELTSSPECLEAIVTSMKTYADVESILLSASGLIACIAGSQKHALNLLDFRSGLIVERMVRAICVDSRKGALQETAMKALLRLSSAHLSSDSSTGLFAEKISEYVPERLRFDNPLADAMNFILHFMKQYTKNLHVQTLGFCLLWSIYSSDIDGEQYFHSSIMNNVFNQINATLESHQDMELGVFRESVMCLLSKVSSNDALLRSHEESFARIVVGLLKTESESSIVALHGYRSLYNVCANESMTESCRLVVSSQEGVNAIIDGMRTFSEHISVQGEACLALAGLCADSYAIAGEVLRQGGIALIDAAFDCYSISKYDEVSLSTKIGACTALTMLAIHPGALVEIKRVGIIQRFEGFMSEKDVPVELKQYIQNVLDACNDSTSVSLEFRDGAGCEECYDILVANLNAISPPAIVKFETASSLRSNIIESMTSFPENQDIFSVGCTILAHVYASDVESDDIETDIETISRRLSALKSSSIVVRSACIALRNACERINNSAHSVVLRDHVLAVCDAISVHHENLDVLEQALGALSALLSIARNGTIAELLEVNAVVDIAIESIQRFPDNKMLQNCCVGFIWSFALASRNMGALVPKLTPVLLRLLDDRDDGDEIVEFIINTVLILSQGEYQFVMALANHETFIDSMVSCMFKFTNTPYSPSIQATSCRILSNLAINNYYRAEICSRGGTSRIIAALEDFRSDSIVVSTALSALTNLISGSDVEILRGSEVSRNIIQAMQQHPENLAVQVEGGAALWVLSSRNDVFKERIVQYGGAQTIAKAMNRFVASEEMQSKGFISLWTLAVHRALKSQVGTHAGSVVNGLCAHICSEKLCEEGIGAIKCLSIDQRTKNLLEESDALDLIFATMWLHSENATIQQASLAALSNLSVDVNADQVLRITPDDLDAIINAMRTHPHVKGVQESAIIVLRNFTCSPSNCLVLQEDSFLGGLIRAAVIYFNDSFHGRAEDLLQVLPALNQ